MSASHTHALPSTGNERALRLALVLTFGFLMTEVVGGILTGRLALISDAAHIFALAIALAAIRIARRPADVRRTYGYHRFEILAAAFNALLLFAVALYILAESHQRFLHPPEVQPDGNAGNRRHRLRRRSGQPSIAEWRSGQPDRPCRSTTALSRRRADEFHLAQHFKVV